jgi:hypothetical protein
MVILILLVVLVGSVGCVGSEAASLIGVDFMCDDLKFCYNCIYRDIVEPDYCDDIPYFTCDCELSPLSNKVTLDYDKCDYFKELLYE